MAGTAGRLLEWAWQAPLLAAAISAVRHFVACGPHKVLACRFGTWPGRRRIDIGSCRSVALAQAACDRYHRHWRPITHPSAPTRREPHIL
jgi:hypothetical protein